MQLNTDKLLNTAMATTSQLGVMLPWHWYAGHAQFSGVRWINKERKEGAKYATEAKVVWVQQINKYPQKKKALFYPNSLLQIRAERHLIFSSADQDWKSPLTLKHFKQHFEDRSKVSMPDCNVTPPPPYWSPAPIYLPTPALTPFSSSLTWISQPWW